MTSESAPITSAHADTPIQDTCRNSFASTLGSLQRSALPITNHSSICDEAFYYSDEQIVNIDATNKTAQCLHNSVNPNSNDHVQTQNHQPPDDLITNEDINRKNEGKDDDDQE
eukprot:504359_1